MIINLDLYQTVAMAVIVFAMGAFLRKKVSVFERYCIPAPVIGGILFALLTLALNLTNVMTIQTHDTMKDVFMTLFFTSVGYTASLKLLKKGGLQVILFTLAATVVVILQDVLGISLASLFGMDPLFGLCVGSIPMVGGHGTASSFGPLLEDKFGLIGATSLSVASATFGLIMGGVIGGPVAKRRIRKKNLVCGATLDESGVERFSEEKLGEKPDFPQFLKAFSMLFLAAGIGTFLSTLINKIGLTVPSYIGAMLAGFVTKSIGCNEEVLHYGKYHWHTGKCLASLVLIYGFDELTPVGISRFSWSYGGYAFSADRAHGGFGLLLYF